MSVSSLELGTLTPSTVSVPSLELGTLTPFTVSVPSLELGTLTPSAEFQTFCPVGRIGYPHPLTHKGVLLPPPLTPPPGPWGETHSLAEEGVGGPDSDEGSHTLAVYVYYNPSTVVNILKHNLKEV